MSEKRLAGLYADWHILKGDNGKGHTVKNRLSEGDYGQVLACIEAIYRCRKLEDFPQQILTELRKLIACNFAGYNEVNLKRNRALILMDPPMPHTVGLQKKFGAVMHQHPVITYFDESGDGQALKISDFLTAKELHELDLYREIYQPLDAEDQISFAVKVEPGFIIGIAFNRAERSFTEKDRLRLNLIRPHIVQAYLYAAEASGHEEQKLDLQTALHENGLGVIALDETGAMLHTTPGALECLANYMPPPDAEPADARHLPPDLLQWARAGDHVVRGEPFIVRHGQGKLIIRCVRHGERILLLLAEEGKPTGDDPAGRFHLTPRENEVLEWITEGKSNSEIAAILGLAAGTVKLHVERILAKLGVENRTAAAMTARSMN
jgi:DNA-binding CsgD family transcriptional regulator